MNQQKEGEKSHFKKTESGYHKAAVETLASWVIGIIEQPFNVDGSIVFVPDVAVYRDGFIQEIWEVVHKHPITPKKYGMIQYWCYMNMTELTVHEVQSDYILRQTENPGWIRKETYIISPF